MKQRISILGCGWLGMPLALALIEKGYIVKGSNTSNVKSDKMRLNGILPYVINLNQRDYDIADFLESDVLLIAVTSKNVDDFRYLIDQIVKSMVKKVLFISSTSVYPNTNQIVTEDSKVNDSALSEIELLFKSNSVFKTTIIRFGGLFGYDRKPGKFNPVGREINNPEGYVNLIHRDDCIRIIQQIIKHNIWQETLNACADTHPKRRDFYKKEAIRLGLQEPHFNKSSMNEYKIISTDKLKDMLSFSYKYSNLLDYEEK